MIISNVLGLGADTEEVVEGKTLGVSSHGDSME